jgi:hypothetical protein
MIYVRFHLKIAIFFYGFGVIAEFLEIFRRRTKIYIPMTNYIAIGVAFMTVCVPIY